MASSQGAPVLGMVFTEFIEMVEDRFSPEMAESEESAGIVLEDAA